MSDLISRADAIEAVASITMSIHLSDVICDKLLALPSAELTLQTPQTCGKSINPSNAEVVEDLISRADAVKTVIRKCSPICDWQVGTQKYPDCVVAEINELPSDAVDCTDFIGWLVDRVLDETIWEYNSVAYGEIICRKLVKLGVLEVTEEPSYYIRPSADAEQKWNCTASFVAEQLDRLRKMTDEEKWEFFRKFFGMGDAVQGEWIPCSERLPSESGWYLITVQGCEKVADMEWYYSECDAWNGVSSEQQVIAWMPLPKPYKVGDTE